MKQQETENYKKAGKIASQVTSYAKTIIKPGVSLLEIAEKIENKILELGGKPAFPVNLCINEIAAHDTPSYNDERRVSGLLKVDIGVSIEGFVADTAFSLDLENNEENKKLIQASELALKNAIEKAKNNSSLNEIGKEIQEAITSLGFSPIKNLSGHEIKEFDLHAGLTIPNYDNNNKIKLPQGVYAIEPFATTGVGLVKDSKFSGIYRLETLKQPRENFDRQVLEFIKENFSTLPFCARWLVKKFSTRALLSLIRLEQAKILHHYPQLIEKEHGKVSQAEHTVLIDEKGKVEVITE